MNFRILGPLELLDGDRSVALPRGRGRALLALLVLHAGEVLSVERLIDELWGQAPPPTAHKALQGLVSDLRKRLAACHVGGARHTVLRTLATGYTLDIDPKLIDAERFRQLVEDGKGAPASERAATLRRALGLWRGPALADFVCEPFAQREITLLEELRLAAIEERVEADLDLGLHRVLISELEALIAEHPFRERLHAQLMLSLYRADRQADALGTYQAARRALVEELGIEPGPTLRQLQQAILAQDPSLELKPLESPPETRDSPVDTDGGWLPRERRALTVMFVDLAVSGEGESADPEAVRRIVARSTELAIAVLRQHGATVEELVGDLLVGLFGFPIAHEDDALRAVRAALELREVLGGLGDDARGDHGMRIPLRTGIESGEVVVGPADAPQAKASGRAINIAAELQRAAGEGEVVVGDGTRRILDGAALLEPACDGGIDKPGRSPVAWRVVDLVPGAPPVFRRLDAPIIGRTAELARLKAALERAVRRRTAYRFTVLGDAGIGKSRLAAEFANALDPHARVITGNCPAYGEGITFRPLREIVLEAAGSAERGALSELLTGEPDREWIAAQVAAALGLAPEPGRPDEFFPAFRRMFEVLATRGPLVVAFEDLHWAEPTLLDLIQYLEGRVRGPMLLLCLARPELIEKRPAWGAGGRNADTLSLEPLNASETEKLIADRMEGVTLAPETLTRIVETAQGNPLFAEQMVAGFRDDGQISVPASVHVLLAARLDRLGPAERDLIRCAAVVGTDFSVEAVSALLPEQALPFLDRHLRAMQQRELIRPALSARPRFSFQHVLIQRAAYRSMTREDRATLHQKFADWLEGERREHPPDLDEILGYHLEKAVEERRLLGEPDETALATRAGEHLARAGARALGRFDIAAAENLSARAKYLLPPEHPNRLETMSVLAEVYPMMGRHLSADVELADMLDHARAQGDETREHVIRLERARIQLLTGPDPTSLDAIRQEAERALEVFSRSGDHARAAQACYVLSTVHEREGAIREMEAVSRRGVGLGRRSGRPREEAGPMWDLAWALRAGPTPVQDAIRQCDELAPWREMFHPGVLCELAHLRAMAREFDEARELIARAKRLMVERMRLRRPLMFAARSSAAVEILAGDPRSGQSELRAALEMAFEFQERDQVSRIAAGLSRLLVIEARSHEADRFAAISEDHAPAECAVAQAQWRDARARVLLRDDRFEAERLLREAVTVAPTEMPNLRADLLIDLAEILYGIRGGEAAVTLTGQAIRLYEQKGNVASLARAHSLLARIST